jgi:hypothetical protein
MLDSMSKAIEHLPKDVAFADIREEVRRVTEILVVDGVLRRFNNTYRAGAVARTLVGECWGQASSSACHDGQVLREVLSKGP